MKSEDIRNRFLDFFKKRGHTIIPSASLVPENDPTVLFNTAGMQPLVPYLMGEPHPSGKRIANIQKCVRTGDIDDIGDNTHLTFFEMLGNWSLGDYFKEDTIQWSFELLTSKEEGFGLDLERLYVTVFAGNDTVPRDEEAKELWMKAGVPEHRIYYLGAEANWWPNVKGTDTWTGPTGPSSEMFYDLTESGLGDLTHDEFMRADSEQKVVEIWNDVFMAYEKKNGQIVGELKSKNVDTGAGLERIATVLQKRRSVFDTDLFEPIMNRLPGDDTRARRIIADHLRAAVFIISDGVLPSNTDQGYVLRRVLRRAVRYADEINADISTVVDAVIEKYAPVYKNVLSQKEHITSIVDKEEKEFRKTLKNGLKELRKMGVLVGDFEISRSGKIIEEGGEKINGQTLFKLFSTFGFPFELSVEQLRQHDRRRLEAGYSKELEITNNLVEKWRGEFEEYFKKHQDQSRKGAEQKFKGGLADTSEMSVKYHTATHLLHQALRDVLGEHVEQKGSNITPDRLRFDFSHPQKMTDAEKQKVEDIVNKHIEAHLPVSKTVLPLSEAKKTGALHFFGEKYGDTVSVYYIGESIEKAISKEFCGGPHVSNTGDLAGVFKIKKEEASSAGVRRIKAVME